MPTTAMRRHSNRQLEAFCLEVEEVLATVKLPMKVTRFFVLLKKEFDINLEAELLALGLSFGQLIAEELYPNSQGARYIIHSSDSEPDLLDVDDMGSSFNPSVPPFVPRSQQPNNNVPYMPHPHHYTGMPMFRPGGPINMPGMGHPPPPALSQYGSMMPPHQMMVQPSFIKMNEVYDWVNGWIGAADDGSSAFPLELLFDDLLEQLASDGRQLNPMVVSDWPGVIKRGIEAGKLRAQLKENVLYADRQRNILAIREVPASRQNTPTTETPPPPVVEERNDWPRSEPSSRPATFIATVTPLEMPTKNSNHNQHHHHHHHGRPSSRNNRSYQQPSRSSVPPSPSPPQPPAHHSSSSNQPPSRYPAWSTGDNRRAEDTVPVPRDTVVRQSAFSDTVASNRVTIVDESLDSVFGNDTAESITVVNKDHREPRAAPGQLPKRETTPTSEQGPVKRDSPSAAIGQRKEATPPVEEMPAATRSAIGTFGRDPNASRHTFGAPSSTYLAQQSSCFGRMGVEKKAPPTSEQVPQVQRSSPPTTTDQKKETTPPAVPASERKATPPPAAVEPATAEKKTSRGGFVFGNSRPQLKEVDPQSAANQGAPSRPSPPLAEERTVRDSTKRADEVSPPVASSSEEQPPPAVAVNSNDREYSGEMKENVEESGEEAEEQPRRCKQPKEYFRELNSDEELEQMRQTVAECRQMWGDVPQFESVMFLVRMLYIQRGPVTTDEIRAGVIEELLGGTGGDYDWEGNHAIGYEHLWKKKFVVKYEGGTHRQTVPHPLIQAVNFYQLPPDVPSEMHKFLINRQDQTLGVHDLAKRISNIETPDWWDATSDTQQRVIHIMDIVLDEHPLVFDIKPAARKIFLKPDLPFFVITDS